MIKKNSDNDKVRKALDRSMFRQWAIQISEGLLLTAKTWWEKSNIILKYSFSSREIKEHFWKNFNYYCVLSLVVV
jgi:hypothetical protein